LFSIRPRTMFFHLRRCCHEPPLLEEGEDNVVLLPTFLFLFSFFFSGKHFCFLHHPYFLVIFSCFIAI
jgi:hypothetical protein